MNAYKPRSYQQACLNNLRKAREEGKRKALVVMASGLGKTLTGAFDIQEFFQSEPNGRILVLCHSEAILSQTKEVFKRYFGDGYSYGMYNGKEKATHRTDFLFANLQSVNLHKDDFDPEEFCFIIVDEAHHSPAETYRKAIEYFKPEFLLGLTATPDRMDDADLSEIFGRTVYEYDLVEAIWDGWLSEVDYRLMLDEFEKIETLLDSGESVSMTQLNREFFAPKRDEEIIRLIREKTADKDNPTMVIFCQTIEYADRIADLMGDAVVIHSKLSDADRNQRLEDFRTGKIKTVCAVDILNEGIDVPRTDVIVFLRATQSKIVFSQQLGRGLRLAEGKGKVLVLDFVATAERLDMIFQFEREFQSSIGRYAKSKSKTTHDYFTLNIDTPKFRERKVDIIASIERAKSRFLRHTDDELLEMLKVKARELGRAPMRLEIDDDPNMPDSRVYARRFGSYTDALRLAGIRPTVWGKVSNEDLLELLSLKAQALGRTPTVRDVKADPDMPSEALYKRRFGSFNMALELAGLNPNQIKWAKISDEELLNLLKKKAETLGRTPTREEIDNDPNMPSSYTYAKRFGNPSKAFKLAGVRVSDKQRWVNESDDDLLKLLARKAEELGRVPTVKDLKNDPNMPDAGVYRKRFGNFSRALRLAGLVPHFQNDLSDEEMLELLRIKAQELGRTPLGRDMDSDPRMPNSRRYTKRFGSFARALELAGLEPNNYQKKRSPKKGGKRASG